MDEQQGGYRALMVLSQLELCPVPLALHHLYRQDRVRSKEEGLWWCTVNHRWHGGLSADGLIYSTDGRIGGSTTCNTQELNESLEEWEMRQTGRKQEWKKARGV